jgi:LPXTG-motif cell wall-anchored protein
VTIDSGVSVEDKIKPERKLTSNQTNYAIVGGIIILLTGYVYYIKKKKLI